MVLFLALVPFSLDWHCFCYWLGLFLLGLTMQHNRKSKEELQGNIIDNTVMACQTIDTTMTNLTQHHKQEEKAQAK